jgi:hypothetical protein
VSQSASASTQQTANSQSQRVPIAPPQAEPQATAAQTAPVARSTKDTLKNVFVGPKPVPLNNFLNTQPQVVTPKGIPPVNAAENTPSAVPYEIQLPTTHLNLLFNQYLSESQDLDAVERTAGLIVAEVFNEDDQIRPKIWELQNLIKERFDNGQYSATDSDRVRILEAGLAKTAAHRETYAIGKDAVILLSSTLAFSVLRGYEVQAPSLRGMSNAVRSAASGTVDSIKQGAEAVGNGASRAFNWKSYKQSGERVEAWFSRSFQHLAPEGSLGRDLEALGVPSSDIASIQSRLLPSGSVDFSSVENSFRFFKTNLPTLRVAAIKQSTPLVESGPSEAVPMGYLIFQQRAPALLRPTAKRYFQTSPMPQNEIEQIMKRLYYGEDKRKFIELVSDQGGVTSTRIPASRFANVWSRAKQAGQSMRQGTANAYSGFMETVAGKFNTPRALQTFMYGAPVVAGLFGAGYAIAKSDDNDDLSDVYLESLVSQPHILPAPANAGRQ